MPSNSKEKVKAFEVTLADFPTSVTPENLFDNDTFINWMERRTKTIKAVQYVSSPELDTLVQKRLYSLFTYLCKHSPFWFEYFQKQGVTLNQKGTTNELCRLPVMKKDSLIDYGDKLMCLDTPTNHISRYSTSGTTGEPLKIAVNNIDSLKYEFAYTFEPDTFRTYPLKDILKKKYILLLGRKATFRGTHYSEYFPLDAFASLSEGKIREEIYKKITQGNFIHLFGYSSVILELMKYAKEDNVPLPIIANLSGEGITSEEELFVQRQTGHVPTFSYTTKEAGKIAAKCGRCIGTNLYHVYRERVIVEIVDENDIPLPNGSEGNIVVTVLDRTTMPIVRYATGDRGKIVAKECNCGRLSPLLALEGRRRDYIILSDNRKFSVLLFRSLFVKEFGMQHIKQYQIIQESEQKLLLRLIPRGEDPSHSKLVSTQKILEKVLGNSLEVKILTVKSIQNYKSGKSSIFIPLSPIPSQKYHYNV